MNKDLREAISAKGAAVTGLNGGFWYIEAPENTLYPYSVFSFIGDNFSRDSGSKFEEIYLQINIYDVDGENIETSKDRIISAFDDSESTFNLTNYHLIRIERQFIRPMKFEDVFQITVQYRILLQLK